jgi:hypothetical protein
MIYCPECGATNDDLASNCTQCGKTLPKLSVPAPHSPPATPIPTEPSSLVQPAPQPTVTDSFWKKLGPDIRAAILTSFVVSGIQALSSIFPGLAFAFSAPFAIIAYYSQGIITGKLAKGDSRYSLHTPKDYAWLGAKSAIWTSAVISTVLILIILAAQFAISLGSIVVLIPIILVNRIADIFLNVCFSTIGAWLYGRSGGHGVLGISIGVLGCGVILVSLLSILVLIILGAIGISIFKSIPGWFGS